MPPQDTNSLVSVPSLVDREIVQVPRIMYATELMAWNEPKLVNCLGSAMWKMVTAKRDPVTFADKTRTQLSATTLPDTTFSVGMLPNDFAFHFGPIPRRFANPTYRRYFLLKDLRGGRDGRVWIGADHSGLGCVIKFRSAPAPDPAVAVANTMAKAEKEDPNVALAQAAASAEREAAMWKTLWDLDAVACSLASRPAVIMPFLKMLHAESSEWDDVSVQQAVREAIRMMLSKGLRHNDVARHHVGLYMRGGQLKAALVDLSDVRQLGEEQHGHDVEQAMLEKLKL